MKRREFFKKMAVGVAGVLATPALLQGKQESVAKEQKAPGIYITGDSIEIIGCTSTSGGEIYTGTIITTR